MEASRMWASGLRVASVSPVLTNATALAGCGDKSATMQVGIAGIYRRGGASFYRPAQIVSVQQEKA